MANSLLATPGAFNIGNQPATVDRGFERGLGRTQAAQQRNALNVSAQAAQRGDLVAAGQAQADVGNLEMVLKFKSLIATGKQAEIDTMIRQAEGVRTTLAAADRARRENPEAFPGIAPALVEQHLRNNPGDTSDPQELLQELLDPNATAAAFAQIQTIDDAHNQAKLEFAREKEDTKTGLEQQKVDIQRGKASESQRANLAREDLQREERQAKVEEKAAKAATEQEKVRVRTQGAIDDLVSTKDTIGRLRDHPGFNSAVGVSIKKTPGFIIPGSNRADFEAVVETVKARLGFAELARMRAASPTGGALGQISERELSFLQAANQSLDTGQTERQFLENIKIIEESLDRLMEAQRQSQQQGEGGALPEGMTDNGDGTFTLSTGDIVRRKQ